MSYVNVGVVSLAENTPFPTKKALKRALVDEPGEVLFFNTALPLGPGKEKYRGDELDSQHTYQVVGPDPYLDRRWYASVAVKDGKPVVIA
jgi:hypothetical protein